MRVDLGIEPQSKIRLQELPLLCVSVLEGRTGEERDLVFTEEAMARSVQEAAMAQEAEAAKAAPQKRRVKKEAARVRPLRGNADAAAEVWVGVVG